MITGTTLQEYLAACKTADINTFKRDNRLNKIFEHTTGAQAREYLRTILRHNPELLKTDFTNDRYGGADVRNFGLVYSSPSTLQYVGVLSNLITLFGSLEGLRIVEIGGGYGGQCRTIQDYCNVSCYHIIDLPEVCELAGAYLRTGGGYNFETFTEPTGQEYDLVISNYALSEIREPERYIEQVLKRSKRGYITCNTNILNLDFSHRRLPDIKSESNENYILVW